MKLSASTLKVANEFWSKAVDHPLDSPERPRTVVRSMPDRDDGVGLFLRENLLVVSIPQRRMAQWRQSAERWTPRVLWQPDLLSGTLSIPRGDLIGPAFVGYTDAEMFRPVSPGPARPLRLEDRPAVQGLRESCDRTEWSHGGSDLQADHPSIGIFEGDRLVTLAGYKLWAGRIAHISIIAHPACRGRGHAAAAVAELTRLVLASGLVRQYRTLESNCPSMAIAAALGFERYATTVWCRIGNVSD